jgi:hypothetical protein
MPTDPRYGWSGRRWRRGRPPWWPENEPWPPQGPDGWRRMRRRFMWRAGLVALVVLVAVAVVISFLVELITSLTGGRPSIVVSALVLIIILVVVAGGLRRLVRGTAGSRRGRSGRRSRNVDRPRSGRWPTHSTR